MRQAERSLAIIWEPDIEWNDQELLRKVFEIVLAGSPPRQFKQRFDERALAGQDEAKANVEPPKQAIY